MGGARSDIPVALRPAVGLIDRMRSSSRLGVVFVLLLVPGLLAAVMYAYGEQKQIDFSDAERSGVVVLEPTLTAMATTAADGTPSLDAVESAARKEGDLDVDKELTAVRQTPNVDTFGALVTQVGNASNLILDPDLDSFYVMDALVVQVPKVLTAAAQAATSTGTPGSADLVAARAVLGGQLSSTAAALRSDVDTALKNTKDGGLKARLAGLGRVADAAEAMGRTITASLGTPGGDASAVATAVKGAVTDASRGLDVLLETRVDGRSSARLKVLSVTTVGFILAFWLAGAVFWRTRHDVALLVDGVKAIARRDVTDRSLPDGRDEFGDIGRALALAREHQAEQDAALAEAARQQEQTNKENYAQQRRAEKQARQFAQQLIEEGVVALTAELDEVATEVQAVRAAAGTINDRVAAAEHALQGVLGQAGQAEQVTNALSDRLQRVAGMAKVIASVADQTKLLALNAEIEAARAGESGQGFRVVANEVKELAATTARSTEEITGTIQALEREADAVSTTINAMASGIGGVDEATSALRGVAVEQESAVATMDERLGSALERVRGMSSLRDMMERRSTERVPLSGTAWLTIDGRRIEVQMKDLSEGGARVHPPERLTLRGNDRARVELPVPGLPPTEVDVLRSMEPEGELALQFVDPPQTTVSTIRDFLQARL